MSLVDFNNDTHALIIDVDDSFEEFSPKDGLDFLKLVSSGHKVADTRDMGDVQLHVRHGASLWACQQYKNSNLPLMLHEKPQNLFAIRLSNYLYETG